MFKIEDPLELSQKPLAYVIAYIRRCGAEAYRLKQMGEINGHLFAASRMLGALTQANQLVKRNFISGWQFAKQEAGGYGEHQRIDLPVCLRFIKNVHHYDAAAILPECKTGRRRPEVWVNRKYINTNEED